MSPPDRRHIAGLVSKIEVPYRVVLHLGEPDMPDDRTFVLPLWAFTFYQRAASVHRRW